jgi:hypothetical protein
LPCAFHKREHTMRIFEGAAMLAALVGAQALAFGTLLIH